MTTMEAFSPSPFVRVGVPMPFERQGLYQRLSTPTLPRSITANTFRADMRSTLQKSKSRREFREEMKAAGEPSEDVEDVPFCVHEDYPCKGDEEKMVYVCHYSPQKGYQTFCIPELDSDILQFDGRNQCGPCDGWNGVENAGQIF